MNPRLKTIFGRRSIRRYEDREVGEDIVRDLLEAAMSAPSAVCRDPWRFIVIRDRPTLSAIADGLPNGKMLPSAALGLAVCGELAAAHDGQVSYMLQDCSAAIENMLLAASTLGLGTCWLGVHPREDRIRHVARALGLPNGVVPIAVIAVGWPGEEKPPRTRYDDAHVHHDRW
jgi:nitroreductase